MGPREEAREMDECEEIPQGCGPWLLDALGGLNDPDRTRLAVAFVFVMDWADQ